MEHVSIDIDESSELLFRVKVEGAEQSPTKIRLVCESASVSMMFAGKVIDDDGLVQFDLPPFTGRLAEGSYPTKVEVIVDNRYFIPVEFNIDVKKTVKVFAESVRLAPKKQLHEIKVTAAPIVKKAETSRAPTLQERFKAKPVDPDDAILDAASRALASRQR